MPTWVTSADPRSASAGSRSSLPALVLVYLGQGALVLADPASAENPFFLLFPNWLLAPAILLTTAATVIASQAVLSGAFALVQQAIQLGAIPRLEVRQTSEEFGWPGLCASSQLAAGGSRSCARLWISLFRRACQRLWNCGRRRHDGHDVAGHGGGLWSVALACGPGLPGRWIVLSSRPHFRVRQCSQDSRGRLVSTARRISLR